MDKTSKNKCFLENCNAFWILMNKKIVKYHDDNNIVFVRNDKIK